MLRSNLIQIVMSLEDFFISWLAEHDAVHVLQLLIVHHQLWVHWVQVPCLLEIFSSLRVLLECFQRERTAEVSMCVLWILLDYNVEVVYCFLVHVYHLVRFRPLMDKPKVTWDFVDALCVWENRLFELLCPAVSQTQMVK